MKQSRDFVFKNFETLLAVLLLATVAVIHFTFENKFAFLNFYYLPALVTGYYLGKRRAILLALASVLTVAFFAVAWPSYVMAGFQPINVFWQLFVWGCFLLLAAVLVGTLYEEKERHIASLKMAYIGILEVLSKYLESGDPYTKNHSVRVAELAVGIGAKMGLADEDLENIRVAGLLHDIGKIEISLDIINKSVSLTETERELVKAHAKRGARLLELAGGVLKQAVPLVEAHHRFFCEITEGEELPLGARIIAVADAYDAMISDRPYRTALPQGRALEEIKNEAGHQFDPDVVLAFISFISAEKEEHVVTAGGGRSDDVSLAFTKITT